MITTLEPHQPPPANHAILLLTKAFRFAIQANNIKELTAINESYIQSLKSNLDFLLYDCSNLHAISEIAMTSSTPTLPPPLHYPHLHPTARSLPLLFHHHLPVSSHPNLSLTTGADCSTTSIPGCSQSSMDSPSPDATTLPSWVSLSKPFH